VPSAVSCVSQLISIIGKTLTGDRKKVPQLGNDSRQRLGARRGAPTAGTIAQFIGCCRFFLHLVSAELPKTASQTARPLRFYLTICS
jgi:hypothetical protein